MKRKKREEGMRGRKERKRSGGGWGQIGGRWKRFGRTKRGKDDAKANVIVESNEWIILRYDIHKYFIDNTSVAREDFCWALRGWRQLFSHPLRSAFWCRQQTSQNQPEMNCKDIPATAWTGNQIHGMDRKPNLRYEPEAIYAMAWAGNHNHGVGW